MELFLKNIDAFEFIFPNVIGAEISEDIIITNRAMGMLITLLNENLKDIVLHNSDFFVRLCMISNDNKAKQYSIKFDNILDRFDRVFELRKLKIVVDMKSLFYFMGIVIDYISDGDKCGFVFFDISDPKVINYYGITSE